eukprot:CAMPEP_0167747082 /NCGR_PEP_ID=MMETSP0110_2-20121227/4079_1 /TAXON_ID=629695 /ORGANISM="Gymnochlora sp., Strain CCMP2014" /LENGTH=76 /DNA_ID=CAMNT_0007631935 /DNA_START=144 /DNA_END=374 /DNA_ORIENTATION=-
MTTKSFSHDGIEIHDHIHLRKPDFDNGILYLLKEAIAAEGRCYGEASTFPYIIDPTVVPSSNRYQVTYAQCHNGDN